ncbi:MAG: 30S ribosomal protein S16 [Minisyncoccota bacterium]
MLKIRLQRTGRKNEPTFRLVLTDSKNSAKSGRFLEILGNYDSRRGEKAEFKSDRITHWMSVGAQVSDTVHNLLVDKKIIEGKKLNKLPKKSAPIKEIVPEVVAEAPAPEVAPAPVVEEAAPVEETPAVETAPEVKEEVAPEAPVVEETPAPAEAPVVEEATA